MAGAARLIWGTAERSLPELVGGPPLELFAALALLCLALWLPLHRSLLGIAMRAVAVPSVLVRLRSRRGAVRPPGVFVIVGIGLDLLLGYTGTAARAPAASVTCSEPCPRSSTMISGATGAHQHRPRHLYSRSRF